MCTSSETIKTLIGELMCSSRGFYDSSFVDKKNDELFRVIDEQQKQIGELMAENELLLELHEAARALLRYNGVDTGRANKVYDDLAAITYEVNDIKQTDKDFLAEHDARVIEKMLTELQDPNYPPMMYDRDSIEEYTNNLRKQGENNE